MPKVVEIELLKYYENRGGIILEDSLNSILKNN